MLRFVQLLAGLLVGMLAVAAFTLYLSHGPDAPPDVDRIEGMGAAARVDWMADGAPVQIEAATDEDALRALGYALATEDAWSMLLWRQAARGRLAEWLGPSVLPQDRHVRLLGIARGADSAASRLDATTRSRLDAFCAGVNAAFEAQASARSAPVALLDVRVEPWTVADVVASERLAAWISVDVPETPFPSVVLGAVRTADARLRTLLAADGLSRSRAWTFADDAVGPDPVRILAPAPGPAADSSAGSARAPGADSNRAAVPLRRLVATYVTGQQATPLFRSAVLRIGGRPPVLLAFLPGTPFPVAGARLDADGSAEEAWAVLPRATAQWERIPATVEASVVAERMNVRGGQEAVLYAPVVGGSASLLAQPPPLRRLVPRDSLAAARAGLSPDSLRSALQRPPAGAPSSAASTTAPSDSAAPPPVALDTVVTRQPPERWRLVWSGTTAGSDAAAWLALWNGRVTPTRLVGLSGLVATRSGTSPLGAAATHRRGQVAADSAVRDRLARRLDRLADLPAWPSDDAVRDDARAAAEAFARRVDASKIATGPERAAFDILRSWDGSYDANGIGSTIFEALSNAERELRGRDAFAAAGDSAYFSELRQTQSFRLAVQRLVAAYGREPSQWRRGAALPQVWRFPLWGTPGLTPPAARRYAPLDVPGGGHPAVLAYGPDLAYGAATTVEYDLSLTPGRPVRVRAAAVDADRVLGRYRSSLDRRIVEVGRAAVRRSTALAAGPPPASLLSPTPAPR